jgi:Raf kinase inhibitor-like YbhB/YbcL family protein
VSNGRGYDGGVRLAPLAISIGVLLLAGCGGNGTVSGPPPAAPNTMKLTSPAFPDGGTLPKQFTCDGKLGGVNPPLAWSRRPRDLKSQALIVEDPDAPGGTYVHWTVWRMMARTTGLEADIPPIGLPQGKNSAGKTGYAPPCPPKGDSPHRYQFIIYALKEPIHANPGAPPDDVIDKIERAALARGTLTGKYGR